jgi:hypothetical protein
MKILRHIVTEHKITVSRNLWRSMDFVFSVPCSSFIFNNNFCQIYLILAYSYLYRKQPLNYVRCCHLDVGIVNITILVIPVSQPLFHIILFLLTIVFPSFFDLLVLLAPFSIVKHFLFAVSYVPYLINNPCRWCLTLCEELSNIQYW